MSGGIYRIGRVTETDFGETIFVRCPNCRNEIVLRLVYQKKWVEYWFIKFFKLFSYRRLFVLRCPICIWSRKLEKVEVETAKRLNEATTAFLGKKMPAEEYKSIVAAARSELSIPP